MPVEKFDRSVIVPADATAVWGVLTDVGTLASWIGIVHEVKELRQMESYTAVLEDKVGPLKLRADLDISVRVLDFGTRVQVTASGRDRAMDSRIAVTAQMMITAASDGVGVNVQGEYQVTGRVASMGAGVIRKKAQGVLDDFFDNVEMAFRPGAAES